MINKILEKLFGNEAEKEIESMQPLVDQINEFEASFKDLSDQQLKEKTTELKGRIKLGTSLEDILPEAFATVREAGRRVLEMRHFDVQLLGAINLHRGNISEMKTGEGKTLVATLAVYLNALEEKGVHVVTVNDYLAKRDAEWMGQLYGFLGLSTGVILAGQSPEQKKEAYAQDITYGTNNEFGFDYLRDNMATRKEDKVMRPLHFAIVDEVDSILIDEARTPLVISAPAESSTQEYIQFAQLVNNLQEKSHYEIDQKQKSVTLTADGISKMEFLLGMKNLYTEEGYKVIHHLEQAVKAKAIFEKDRDYIVSPEGEVVIIDEFTGRAMAGRRFSEGIHQAIEAKEGVEIKQESKTLASITFQNYFRLYPKLAGMTGTAMTEAEEFANIYDLGVTPIPTNRAISRIDDKDAVYKNEQGKFAAILKEVQEVHKTGQPILIGTVNIDKSELLSHHLKQANIPHNVLNAKQHEREAEIVTNAGKKGAITIATNMAGRGTDIKLEEGVQDLGGLYIIGTERHESRRIDNQLRGRSGRQGDKGRSKFYLSMEDEVMRRFGAERIQNMMNSLGIPDDMPIENGMITRSVESAQKKIEGHNYDIRKHILKYDDVMNKQREIIYKRRNKILDSDEISQDIKDLIDSEIEYIIKTSFDVVTQKIDSELVITELNKILTIENISESISDNAEATEKKLKEVFQKAYTQKEEAIGSEQWKQIEKQLYLKIIDTLWMEHIDAMTHLRENVSLQGYGQRDPLILYKEEGFKMFEGLLGNIQQQFARTIFSIQLKEE